jgi:hypothetical protein
LYTTYYKLNIVHHDGLTMIKMFQLYFLAFMCRKYDYNYS